MITKYDWPEIISLNEPTEAYTKFIKNFSPSFNTCLPLKNKKRKIPNH